MPKLNTAAVRLRRMVDANITKHDLLKKAKDLEETVQGDRRQRSWHSVHT